MSEPDTADRPTGWRVQGSTGLVAVTHDRALVVDLSSVATAEDLADLLQAFEAPEPLVSIGFVLDRLSDVACGVAFRDAGGRVLVAGHGGVQLVQRSAARPVTLEATEVSGDFELRAGPPTGDRWSETRSGLGAGDAVAWMSAGVTDADESSAIPWWQVAQPRDQDASGDVDDASAPTPPPPAPPSGDEPKADIVIVQGVVCANGHLNNPASLTCMFDGLSLITATTKLVSGPRPSFASLILESGRAFPLRRSTVLGRDPSSHPLVVAGSADHLPLVDSTGAMSRIHAQVRLQEWDAILLDETSRHGTFVRRSGARSWAPVPSDGLPLQAGDLIRLGGCSVRFERHDGG